MKFRCATRGSKLALVQSIMVKEALGKLADCPSVEIVTVTTIGDRKQGTVLAALSDKRDWIHDLELAVLNGDAEFAVHSGKDVPAEVSPETLLLPVLSRGDPSDTFIGRFDKRLGRRIRFSEVREGGTVGTASLRRRAQLLMLRPDLQISPHRGNVPTRIEKLDKSEELEGIVLASAGIGRLGLSVENSPFQCQEIMPAINQGLLVAQVRKDRHDILRFIRSLVEPQALAEFEAERACVQLLEADCNSAVSIFAQADEKTVNLQARVMMPDGSACIAKGGSTCSELSGQLGTEIANALIASGAKEILTHSRRPG
jgi:hydroxymethylbilane synthase